MTPLAVSIAGALSSFALVLVVLELIRSRRLREVPVGMRTRGGGRSSITPFRSVYYMAKVLLALFVGIFRRNVVPLEDR